MQSAASCMRLMRRRWCKIYTEATVDPASRSFYWFFHEVRALSFVSGRSINVPILACLECCDLTSTLLSRIGDLCQLNCFITYFNQAKACAIYKWSVLILLVKGVETVIWSAVKLILRWYLIFLNDGLSEILLNHSRWKTRSCWPICE